MEQSCLFGPNFLEKFVGKSILRDPKVAVIELIANAWDAGANSVEIVWPTSDNEQFFSIQDNGVGLADDEFQSRWRTLAYDRLSSQGDTIIVGDRERTVFGRNGVGRFSGFCFGDSYIVRSTKNGNTIEYEVAPGSSQHPFTLKKRSIDHNDKRDGTRIFVTAKSNIRITQDEILAEIGMRFLTDPTFKCNVNEVTVDFAHIPEDCIKEEILPLESGNFVEVKIIETNDADKTTKQHGIAWHVNGRLVGEANWKDYGFDEIIDGRSSEAKKHTFIIKADFLSKSGSVKQDWTGFNDTPEFEEVRHKVYEFVKQHILGLTKQKREKAFSTVRKAHEQELSTLTPLRAERWRDFIIEIQEECTNITEKDLIKLAGVLVKMEKSDTKYSLVTKLHEMNPNQLDSLHEILADWTLDLAKEVLDELQLRMKLLDELRERVLNVNTREVQDLQPLFHQGLWMFGPEYETIEFTSNEGMTKVIQNLFKVDAVGSRNRPDFAILPDSSVGSYSYPTYDDEGAELGIDRLVVVELKKPGIAISTDEKSQCWKYVSELMRKGLIDRETKVTCFVLGSQIDPIERDARKENNDRCIIQPLDYQIVIARAKSRLLKLYDRVKGAPFLENQRQELNNRNPQNVLQFEKG